MLDERDYWLGFSVCGGFGPKRFDVVLKVFTSAKRAWQAEEKNWQKIKLPRPLIEKFLNFRQKFNLDFYKTQLAKKSIIFLTSGDKDYPANLKKIDYRPYLLYLKGKLLPQDNLAVSIVGTRKVSGYGREVTERITRGLVARNLTIVSGLARGVDSLSHRLALEFGGRTLAVVGHGLDMLYPPENKPLAQKIIQNGAIVSQFPLGVRSLPGNFPARNKILAGLSLGTVVVEGLVDSGSLITAGFAQEYGRPVFAIPGPITSSLSDGPATLIKSGAKLITQAEDILKELKIPSGLSLGQKNQREQKEIKFNNGIEEKIWQILTTGIRHIDQLVEESGINPTEILPTLTQMELDGKVKNLGNGEYCL
jgi:DNA processing protein